jgi:hypothetical protein
MLNDEQMARLAEIEDWYVSSLVPGHRVRAYNYRDSSGCEVAFIRPDGKWCINQSVCWRLMVKHRAYVAATLDGGWDFIVGNPARLASSGDPAEALALAILAAHPEDHHE